MQNYVIRGVEYAMDGDHHAAIAEFNRVIELDPKNEDAYAFRGSSYASLGEWDKAISDFTYVIALNRKDDYYFQRGGAYFMLEKFSEARSDLETALRINPENADAKATLDILESIGC